MNKIQYTLTVMLMLTNNLLFSQSITHPWKVVDCGGGRLTSGEVVLHVSIAQPAIQRMVYLDTGLVIESGYLPGVRQLSSTPSVVSLTVESNWNMISVPLLMNDNRKNTLFPSARSSAFAYENGYASKDTMQFLTGYWLKFDTADYFQFSGTSVTWEALDVADKWNMIGCLSNAVPVSQIIPVGTTVASSYFGFSNNSGYFAEDTLKPGKAYWIKLNGTGKLVLQAGMIFQDVNNLAVQASKKEKPLSLSVSSNDAIEGVRTIMFVDALQRERMLQYTVAQTEMDESQNELPPPPPSGIFDVRFKTQNKIEMVKEQSREIPIQILSAEYPVTIRWTDGAAILIVNNEEIQMQGVGTTTILNPETLVKLKLSPSSKIELPNEFALMQNYPNPFNPTTVIRYSLPVDSWVTLKVYNILGEEVVTLINNFQEAGYKSVEWNANGFSSGVYTYRLNIGAYSAVKKLMYIR